MIVRKARLAGSWYSSSKSDLTREIEKCFLDKEFGPGELPKPSNNNKRNVIGGVSPHAGYRFSGPCAAHTYYSLFKEKIPDTVIVIGFYHRDFGPDAILEQGEWETPLGNLEIDSDFTRELLGFSQNIVSNNDVFLKTSENSIELQMPFIKYSTGENGTKIVPIKITSHDLKDLDKIATDIADTIKKIDKDIVIVASSDMSHYNVFNENDLKVLKEIDNLEIEQFLTLNATEFIDPHTHIDKNLYKTFGSSERATVCGRHTITTLMLACNKLNAKRADLRRYYASKDIYSTGDSWTVGYFSGIISMN